MSAQPPTTEKAKAKWILARAKTKGSYLAIDVNEVVLVHVGSGSLEDVAIAMQNPANVLYVSAYPGVVAALKEIRILSLLALNNDSMAGHMAARGTITVKVDAALSAVQPEGAAND